MWMMIASLVAQQQWERSACAAASRCADEESLGSPRVALIRRKRVLHEGADLPNVTITGSLAD
jgi:hypothetical protein